MFHDAHRQGYKLLGKKASSCRSVGVVESKKELIAFVGLFRAPGMMVRERESKREKEARERERHIWRRRRVEKYYTPTDTYKVSSPEARSTTSRVQCLGGLLPYDLTRRRRSNQHCHPSMSWCGYGPHDRGLLNPTDAGRREGAREGGGEKT